MTRRSVAIPPVRFDQLRAHRAAVAALASLVEDVRHEAMALTPPVAPPAGRGADTVLGFLRTGCADRASVAPLVGEERLGALAEAEVLSVFDDLLVMSCRIVFVRGLAVLVPAVQIEDGQQVYWGTEAPWLATVAWRQCPPDADAADLATGTGFVGAVLTARCRSVVVADISAAAVDCAAITLELNRTDRCASRAVVADIGSGLEDHSFDLVVANPPWVPSAPGISGVLFADGGATGMELPGRFVDEALRLLRPGGVAVIAVFDGVWADGRRPLDDVVAALERRGAVVSVEHAPPAVYERDPDATPIVTEGLVSGVPAALVFRTTAAQ